MRSRGTAVAAARVILVPVLAVVLAGCGILPGLGPGAPTGTITGRALAGPVCPVETNPPDPGCAARPVPGATIVVATPDGREVARTTTDQSGTFSIAVPAGDYGLTGEPVEGLMGNPSTPVPVSVVAGRTTVDVLLEYDTGIR